MASKFQNRLVGTIIIVALGVIVLPGLLDGKKKHYQDNFAAIPLVPKPGDADEADASPQASQSLPSQPPEGAGAAVEQASQAPADDDGDPSQRGSAPDAAPAAVKENPPARREPVKASPPRVEAAKPATPRPEPAKPLAAKPAEVARLPEPAKPLAAKPAEAARLPEPAKPAPVLKPATPVVKDPPETPPQGQAWVVQLGALKNAAKVTEIVGKLRLSGYRVYTTPTTPVAGQITRIFVGPDASRQKLEAALPEMNQLSGLSGQIRSYQVR